MGRKDLRYSKDKVKLGELVKNNPAYQSMEEDAYDMAVAYTNAKELIAVKESYRREGKVDMCQALTEMLQDERREGMEQGLERGLEQGLERGIEAFILDNQEEGITRQRVMEKLVRRFGMTSEKAERYLGKYNYCQ